MSGVTRTILEGVINSVNRVFCGWRIDFPRFRDLERLNEEIYEEAVYLFTIDEERFYLVQNISRERLSEFTMENKESFR